MRERLIRLHCVMSHCLLVSTWSLTQPLSWLLFLLLPLMGLTTLAHAQTVPQVLESGFEWQRNSESRPERKHENNPVRNSERDDTTDGTHGIAHEDEYSGQNSRESDLDLSDVPDETSVDTFALTATLETDRLSAYVNEQILLTLKVSAPAIAFNITGSQLRVENAELVSLHRKESVEQINGMAFQTSRNIYALFAREPGILQLPTLAFKAMLPVGAGSDTRDKTATTDLSPSTNPIIKDSTDAFELSIEKAPSTDKLWFPAQSVELSSSWSVDTNAKNAVHAGAPVTRRITIQVAGQHPAAIPDSTMPAPEGVRSYPEPPRIDSQLSPTGLNGTRLDSAAIIASHPGVVMLPAVDVHWWDINRREWRTSSLPAEQLQVQPASSDVSATLLATSRWYRQILFFGSIVIATLSVICLLLWLSNRRLLANGSSKQGTAGPAKPTSENAAWARLRWDIRRKDLPGIRCSLQNWGQSLAPTSAIQPLEQLARTWPALTPILQALDAALYSQHASEAPALDQLLRELKLLRAQSKSRSAPASLSTTMYP